jgi:hypothetical protein
MKTYKEIKSQQPVLFECFFAFGNDQFKEGKEKAGIVDKKIFDGGHGLYGTQEGIKKLFDDYDKIDQEIADNCNPQDVYDYEFTNHECSYTNDDESAIKIVVGIFGKEKAKEVKRHFGYIEIDKL